jgi:hypothetical protein
VPLRTDAETLDRGRDRHTVRSARHFEASK